MLRVKNIFGPTVQGEGRQSGMAAIFVRFAGCNMWSGRPEDRAASACPFCDTDFLGGEPMTAEAVADRVHAIRGRNNRRLLVVLTGGEPMLQNENDLCILVHMLRRNGFVTQVETNGTVWKEQFAQEVSFITVSPKKSRELLKVNWDYVDCLKLLHPHPSVDYHSFTGLPFESGRRKNMDFCIQPIDEPGVKERNTQLAVDLVKELGYPWRLSLQTHKLIGEE